MAFSLSSGRQSGKVIKLSGKCNMDKLEILMTIVLEFTLSQRC